MMTRATLSILIPTYNDACSGLVAALHEQAEVLDLDYEIIVADDGSTNMEVVRNNRSINDLPHCRYVEQPENRGRAAIRNFLARQAHHEWLLFIDSDMMVCRQDYLQKYLLSSEDDKVVFGGVAIAPLQPGNLRSLYEKASEQDHRVEKRQLTPYQDFHTANFMVRRDIMLAHPFDQRFRHYGYEDVLFGKQLERHAIPIHHVDNPMSFEKFESNADFVSKTEEGLRTLYQFRDELKGYSRMLDTASRLPHGAFRLWHRLLGKWERRQLTGDHPRLWIFKLYKMGYFLSLF